MSASLVQSGNYSTFNSGTGVATGYFGFTTGSGNLLMCVVYASITTTVHETITFGTPVTTGLTWRLGTYNSASNSWNGNVLSQQIAIYYSANSAVIGTSTPTTILAAVSPPGSFNCAFELVEVNGIDQTSLPILDPINYPNQGMPESIFCGRNSGISNTPNAGSINTINTDFLFVSATSLGGNSTGGNGWTLLDGNMGTFGTGAINQYILNASAGAFYYTGFQSAVGQGAATAPWIAVLIGFKVLEANYFVGVRDSQDVLIFEYTAGPCQDFQISREAVLSRTATARDLQIMRETVVPRVTNTRDLQIMREIVTPAPSGAGTVGATNVRNDQEVILLAIAPSPLPPNARDSQEILLATSIQSNANVRNSQEVLLIAITNRKSEVSFVVAQA